MFDQFVAEISATNDQALTILELGSGPGVLAEHILSRCPVERYWLVDFSPKMHELADERLGEDDRAIYVQTDFKSPSWNETISERVEVVVTMQALHELRHSSRASRFYRQRQKWPNQVDSYLFVITFAPPMTRDRCTCPFKNT